MKHLKNVISCACVLLFFLFPLLTHAETITIPDVNLRAAIENALGKTSGATITADDMTTLTKLVADHANIRDLTGLEYAVRLRELRVRHNTLSDLSSLAGLFELHTLNLEHNIITDLSPLADLVSLHNLRIGHNLIADLSPLENLINLSGLDMSHNAITDLSPLSGLTKLNWIGITENPLGDLSPLTKLRSLRSFFSWGTPIINLSALSELPNLQVLDICGGELSDISTLEGMTQLTELYLAGNSISNISVLSGLPFLKRLNLDGNQIEDISSLSDLSNLRWVNISNNNISDISALEALGLGVSLIYYNNPAFRGGGPKIGGPWLWILVPGDRISDGDMLSVASDGRVTEQKVATVGASEGKRVGGATWIADNIAVSARNNIGEMVRSNRLGTGVVYGSTTLESPREQATRMFVGAHDGVKVWLNGQLVYQKASGTGHIGYHTHFPATLETGTNVLLVMLDNRPDHSSNFHASFGFDVEAVYTLNAPINREKIPTYDVNEDGQINILDLILVGQNLGKSPPTHARADVTGDGRVNISDLVMVANHLGEITGIPPAPAMLTLHTSGLNPATVKAWITQAQIADDGSLVFHQGIATLQRLLEILSIPKQTALFPNYPNPFNPETWIPYQLAKPTDVTLTIYTATGEVIRVLELGNMPAGIYQTKSRAIYWDGKNSVGEVVASGLYFYVLTAGDFTATRKMLILK